jgi:hypothetical protein
MDPSIPIFFSSEGVIKLLLAYYTGLLPFMRIHYDVLSIPYMTRDYLRMKLEEGREKSKWMYPYAAFCILSNMTINPLIDHLNKRGIYTCYWVINDDDEIRKVIH